MAERQIDSEDDLKRRTRRRLVGAVALFTALVVIVPMVLDREPRQTGQDIDLRIPDKDKAGAFSSQMVLPEPVSAPAAASAPAGTEPSASAEPAQKPASAAAKPEQPAKQEHSTKAEHSAKPEHSTKPDHSAKPEHKAASAEPTKSAHAKEGFSVQVGAFSNAASAAELRDKLHKQGWAAYTEKAGSAVRVRVGPYSTREAAEKALHSLEAQGMHPTLVSAS